MFLSLRSILLWDTQWLRLLPYWKCRLLWWRDSLLPSGFDLWHHHCNLHLATGTSNVTKIQISDFFKQHFEMLIISSILEISLFFKLSRWSVFSRLLCWPNLRRDGQITLTYWPRTKSRVRMWPSAALNQKPGPLSVYSDQNLIKWTTCQFLFCCIVKLYQIGYSRRHLM